MARNPTPWSNNDTKNPTSFTASTKVVSQWANNITKLPAVFVAAAKSIDSWGIHYQASQTYFYNDSNIPYNSSLIQYNYLLNNNQLNQELMTRWGQVV